MRHFGFPNALLVFPFPWHAGSRNEASPHLHTLGSLSEGRAVSGSQGIEETSQLRLITRFRAAGKGCLGASERIR